MNRFFIILILLTFSNFSIYSIELLTTKKYNLQYEIDSSRKPLFLLRNIVKDKSNNLNIFFQLNILKNSENMSDSNYLYILSLNNLNYDINWQKTIIDKNHIVEPKIYNYNNDIIVLSKLCEKGNPFSTDYTFSDCYVGLFRIDNLGNINKIDKQNNFKFKSSWDFFHFNKRDIDIFSYNYNLDIINLDTSDFTIKFKDTILINKEKNYVYNVGNEVLLDDSTLLINYRKEFFNKKYSYFQMKYNLHNRDRKIIHSDFLDSNLSYKSFIYNNITLYHSTFNNPIFIYDYNQEKLIKKLNISDYIKNVKLRSVELINGNILTFIGDSITSNNKFYKGIFFVDFDGKILDKIEFETDYQNSALFEVVGNKLYLVLKPIYNDELDYNFFLFVYDITNLFSSIDDEPTFSTNLFNIYPNPSSSYIDIDLKDINVIEDIIIYNTFGQTLITQKAETNTQRINIEQLPSGIYFIKIGDKVEKFVKI